MQSVRNLQELPSAGDVTGTTRFVGSLQRPVVIKNGQSTQIASMGNTTTITTTYQALPSDGMILAGNTTSYTITLPAIADVVKGFTLNIQKTGASGTLTIDGSGSETIDGSLTVTTATQYTNIMLVMNGTSWTRLNPSGSVASRLLTVTTQTTTATVASTDDLTIDTGTASHTLTLPAVSGLTGTTLRFKKTGVSGVVTIDGAGSETIDGALTFTLTEQYESAAIICDGTGWQRMDNTPVLTQQAVTTTATILPNTDIVLITAEAGTYAITLPTPALRGAGKTLTIKKATATGSNAQTLTRVGAETIDGATSLLVTAARRSIVLYSDGTDWHLINDSTPAAG